MHYPDPNFEVQRISSLVKKNILIAVILLCSTLFIIVGLQLYSHISGYKAEEEIFRRKINEGLKLSVEKAFELKRAAVIEELTAYLNDESKVTITCKWSEKNEATIFTIADRDTSVYGQHRVSFSKGNIPGRIDSVTPGIKARFIRIFTGDVEHELKKGTVWYYTVNIGNFLHERYFKTPTPLSEIATLYRQNLAENYIYEPFELNPAQADPALIATQNIDMTLHRASEPQYVQAFFKSPYTYIIRRQAVALTGSLLLIVASVITLGYMLKILLSQQKLNEQKDQLVTNITHELKTPLTTIQVTAEAVKAFDLSREEVQRYMDIIVRTTGALDKITTEMLTEARVGQLHPQMQLTDVRTLVDEAGRDNDTLEIVNEVAPSLTLHTDPALLGRVFKNLIDNSAKYNTSTGKKVVISAVQSQQNLTILVADNGIGIPDTYKDQVFERFFRVPTRDVHDHRGYGIGLSYVKQAMKVLGGSVKLNDNSPQGSIFTLIFPQ